MSIDCFTYPLITNKYFCILVNQWTILIVIFTNRGANKNEKNYICSPSV